MLRPKLTRYDVLVLDDPSVLFFSPLAVEGLIFD